MSQTSKITANMIDQQGSPYVGWVSVELVPSAGIDGTSIVSNSFYCKKTIVSGSVSFDLVPNASLSDDSYYAVELHATEENRFLGVKERVVWRKFIVVPDHDANLADIVIMTPVKPIPVNPSEQYLMQSKAWAGQSRSYSESASSKASEASASAASAAASASAAGTAKTAAEVAQASAESAMDTASASAGTATSKASEASASAASAAASASDAGLAKTAAESAQAYAESARDAASASAGTASSKASEASASAASAAASAQSAATAEVNISTAITEHDASIGSHADIRSSVVTLNSGISSLSTALNGEKKKVKTLEKTVENLTKAAQGTIYDDVTDSRELHSKTLGDAEICGSNTTVLPNGEITSIGGRTVVWNQNIDITKITTAGYTDVEIIGGDSIKATLTRLHSASRVEIYSGNHTMYKGHKYYVYMEFEFFPTGENPYIEVNIIKETVNPTILSKTQQGTSKVICNTIYTADETSSGRFFMYCRSSSTENIADKGWNLGDYFVIRRPQMVDLTLMFGAGNEPATTDAFEALFDTSKYYPYNSGTLMSLPVKSVVTEGKNLLDVSKYPVTTGYWISENGPARNENFQAILDFFPCGNLQGVEIIVGPLSSGSNPGVYFYGKADESSYISSVKNSDFSSVPYVVATVPLNAKYLRFASDINSNPYICRSFSGSGYSPFCRNTLVVPQSVKALTGYGWSAGSVCNEVDWSAKTYTQRVGKVDLGTLTWTYKSDYTVFSTGIPSGMVPAPDWTHYANATCGKYSFGTQKNVVNESVSGIAVGASNIFIRDAAYTDAAAFKTAMSGVMLYYELATPIVTDISDSLPDNLLTNLETGGTVTFVADGVEPSGTVVLTSDEQSIPVPSTIAYQTKIAS